MSKWLILPLALLFGSCDRVASDAGDPNKRPPLVVAAQSVSIEFPFHFGVGDSPPGYIKVAAAKEDSKSSGRLIDALLLCSPDLLWIERTSHTTSAMIPSEENAIWDGVAAWHPSDEEIIACIKQNVSQPFFYRKVLKGTETYRQR
jgi:hypothetical protein